MMSPTMWLRQFMISTTTGRLSWFGWALLPAQTSPSSRVMMLLVVTARRGRNLPNFAPSPGRWRAIFILSQLAIWLRMSSFRIELKLTTSAMPWIAKQFWWMPLTTDWSAGLWWTRIPWPETTKHPFTNHPLRWSQHQKLHRLHAGEPHQDPNSVETYGMKFHPSVLDRQKLPCFTTPSTEGGRPAPKKLKGRIDPETKSRWLSDQRTYAPFLQKHSCTLQMARCTCPSRSERAVTLATNGLYKGSRG